MTRAAQGPRGRHSAWRRVLGPAAIALSLLSLAVSLVLTPPDAHQGQSQRLMYVHVPAAWVAYGCFVVVLVASVAFLVGRDLRWDRRAQAAAEVGVGLTALTIALGSLWGRATWGVWWTWDARLVTTAILLVVYVGYLGVRGLADEPQLNARRAALVGILGFVNVPIVHFSVVWWRTLHQPPTVLSPAADRPIAAEMAVALGLGVLAFTMLAWWVIARRVAALDADAAPEPQDVARAGGTRIVVRSSRPDGRATT